VTDDFAIAEILPGVQFAQPPGLAGFSNRWRATDFPHGLRVSTIRPTGPAHGTIFGMDASVRLAGAWGNVSFTNWQYHNLVLYDVPNTPGDSGAAVIEVDTNQALGIHIGGNGGMKGLMYPLRPIVDRFDLELVP